MSKVNIAAARTPSGQRKPGGSGGARGRGRGVGQARRRVHATNDTGTVKPLPAPVRRHRGRPPGADRPGRPGPARQSAADQGARLPDRGARGVPAARPAARPRPDHRGAGRARARAPAGQARRPRAVHRPGRAPGPQRDAVLPAARRAPRGVPADRLHADRRAGLPGVQPHHPAHARHLDHAGRRRPHPGDPAPGPVRGRPAHRRDRQRADPRASATRAPAAWPSRSASSPCTRRPAASIRR